MAKDVYDKARAYALDKNNFGIVQDTYSKIFNTVSIEYIHYNILSRKTEEQVFNDYFHYLFH